jgi:hypothetical protein
MGLLKYRDPEAARRDLWTDGSDPDLPGRIRRLWALSARLAPLRIPRGLRKFRTIEEANEEREAWVRRRVQRIRSTHHG